MKQLRKFLNTILNILAGVSFLAMVGLTCWQVFTRYILQNPSSWSEELVSYLFAWMALLGASLVVGERGHMNIPILVDRMGPGARKVLSIFAEIIACIFAAVILVYGGLQITSLAMGQMTSSLGIPVGIFYVVLPLCGVINIIYTIMNIIGILNGEISTEPVDEAAEEAAKAASQGAVKVAAQEVAQEAAGVSTPDAVKTEKEAVQGSMKAAAKAGKEV